MLLISGKASTLHGCSNVDNSSCDFFKRWRTHNNHLKHTQIQLPTFNYGCSPECSVNRPIPADKRTRRKENEKQKAEAKRHSRPITGRWQLRWCYEVHQWTNHIEKQQNSICYNTKATSTVYDHVYNRTTFNGKTLPHKLHFLHST